MTCDKSMVMLIGGNNPESVYWKLIARVEDYIKDHAVVDELNYVENICSIYQGLGKACNNNTPNFSKLTEDLPSITNNRIFEVDNENVPVSQREYGWYNKFNNKGRRKTY